MVDDGRTDESVALNYVDRPKAARSVLTGNVRLAFAGVLATMVLAALDQNIVNTSLPRIASDLGGLSRLSWIITAFMLTSTVTMPLYGKLSDMYGRKLLLTVSITGFITASVLCGLAQTLDQLILFRALQGMSAGGLIGLSQTVIGDIIPARERGRYVGFIAGAFTAATVSGPLVGGIITTHLSWRYIFYVNVPIGAVALFLIRRGLQLKPPRQRHRIDFEGAALLALGTTCLLIALSLGGSVRSWSSPEILALLGGATVFAALFLVQEFRAKEPIVSPALFRNTAFGGLVATNALMNLGMMAAAVFAPLYFQLVLGKSPVEAGLLTLPQPLAMTVLAIGSGQLSSRFGIYKGFIVLGAFLETAAFVALAALAYFHAQPVLFEVALALLGCGAGLCIPNLTAGVQNAVEPGQIGAATATLGFGRSLGGSIGVAMAGGVVAAQVARTLGHAPAAMDVKGLVGRGEGAAAGAAGAPVELVNAYAHAIATSFMISALLLAFALLIIVFLRTPPLPDRSPAGA